MTKPKEDTRPFEVYDPQHDADKYIIRCWFKETAQEYIKMSGMKRLKFRLRQGFQAKQFKS